MADIAKIELNGVVYDVKDAEARNDSESAIGAVSELTTRVGSVEGAVNSLEQNVSTINTNLAQIDETTDQLNTDVDSINNSISNINQRVTNVENQGSATKAIAEDAQNVNNRQNESITSLQRSYDTLSSEYEETSNQLSVLESRMDSFTNLPDGSTSADAELSDARIGVSGATFSNVGGAIRTQVKENIQNIGSNADGYNNVWINNYKKQGYSPSTGLPISGDSTQISSNMIYVGDTDRVLCEVPSGYRIYAIFYSSTSDNSKTSNVGPYYGNWMLEVADDYMRIVLVKSNYATIDLGEASNINVYKFNMAVNREAFIFGGYHSDDGVVSIDTEQHTITFGNYAILVYGNRRIDLSNRSIDYTAYAGDYCHIWYDYSNDAFTFTDAGRTSKAVSKTMIYIGCIWFEGRFVEINAKPCYKVNGVFRTINDSRFGSPKRASGSRMAVLGDSISTFTNYSETGSSYWGTYYPNGDVSNVGDMWWEKVRKGLGLTECSVSAISRSGFKPNPSPTIIYGGDSSRISRLGVNGTPEYVFVELGLNDAFSSLNSLGSKPYTNDISTLQSNDSEMYSAVGECLRKIQDSYPSAKIVVLLPKNLITGIGTTYSMENQVKYTNAIKEMAEQIGVYKIIDLRDCGINVSNATSYTINNGADGIHPNKAGMQLIADYIIEQLIGK